MNNKKINTHDRFFKSLFSNKNGVREFVSKTISPSIVEKLDLNTLEIDNTEYLDNRLNSSFSDLVYNCKYGKSSNVKISLLFEHKSQPEKFPHFQLLGYMLRIWELQIKQNKELTAVIPIIFYHGKKKWDNKGFEEYFGNIDNELQNFIPKFD
ncbi:MAG: Rpn family recombination-promoting nuclease/putative transposase, partial [Bacteroidota bacterium]|nr:Rpn family recombination-promoting nuclease/putative transposase [Bacteroidota bacterium]